jgi:O-antigen/teichoic acid export membrane protein
LVQFARVLRFYRTFSFGIGVAVAVLGLVFGRPIMHLVYTSAFEAGVLPFQILCIAVGLSFAEGPMNWAMMATKYEGRVFTRACLTAAATILFSLVLIPRYGLLGAAFATLAASVFAVLVTWVNFRITLRDVARIQPILAERPGS